MGVRSLSSFLKTARRYGKKVMGVCGGRYRRFELPFCAVKKVLIPLRPSWVLEEDVLRSAFPSDEKGSR